MRTSATLAVALSLLAALCSCATSRSERSVLGSDLGPEPDLRVTSVRLRDGRTVSFEKRGAMMARDSAGPRVIGVTVQGVPRAVPIDSVVEARLTGSADPPELGPGHRVVVLRRDGTAVGGMLEAIDGDTLVLGAAGSTIRLERGEIERVSVLLSAGTPAAPCMLMLGGYGGALLVNPIASRYTGGYSDRSYIHHRTEAGMLLAGVSAVALGWLGYEIDRTRAQQRLELRSDESGWSELARIGSDDPEAPPPLSVTLHLASVTQSASDGLNGQLEAARLGDEYYFGGGAENALLWARRVDVAYRLVEPLEVGAGWADISELPVGGSARDRRVGSYSYDVYATGQITGDAWLLLARYHPVSRRSRVDLALTAGAGLASAQLRRELTSWRTPQDVGGDGTRESSSTVRNPAGLLGGRVGYALSPSLRIGLHIDHIFAGSLEAPGDALTGLRPATIPLGNTGVGLYFEQRF